MIATLVHVRVKPEFREVFVAATKINHENSAREPGNLRFDILEDASDPCKFVFYEAYLSEEAAAAHKKTTHYKQWRDLVEPWMAGPREGIRHAILFPATF